MHVLIRRFERRATLAFLAVLALITAVSIAVPTSRASAASVGAGDCASVVGGSVTTKAATEKVKVTNDGGATFTEATLCKVAFLSGSGTWTVPAGITSVRLVVFGGGGGGGNFGGGGGGGLVEYGEYLTGRPATYAVTSGAVIDISVGAGGAGGDSATAAQNGQESKFGDLVAPGGGAGGSLALGASTGTKGSDGGNGGGGAPDAPTGPDHVVNPGEAGGATPAGTPTFGKDGGDGASLWSTFQGGGRAAFGTPNTYVAGGGGGGTRKAGGDPKFDGAGFVQDGINDPGWYGGEGGRGVFLDLGEGVLPYAVDGVFRGYGAGGDGGVAAYGTRLAQASGVGHGETFGEYVDPGLGQVPLVNSASGGPGGGGYARKGYDGGSGFVIVGFILGSGGGGGGGAAGAPGAPTGVTPTGGNGSADVVWTPPADNGGSDITGYGVEQSSDGGATWTSASMCTRAATTCTVTGLTNGTGYVFRVSATNAIGTGPWSDPSVVVTPGIGPRFAG